TRASRARTARAPHAIARAGSRRRRASSASGACACGCGTPSKSEQDGEKGRSGFGARVAARKILLFFVPSCRSHFCGLTFVLLGPEAFFGALTSGALSAGATLGAGNADGGGTYRARPCASAQQRNDTK